jgi:hypothetical protein
MSPYSLFAAYVQNLEGKPSWIASRVTIAQSQLTHDDRSQLPTALVSWQYIWNDMPCVLLVYITIVFRYSRRMWDLIPTDLASRSSPQRYVFVST